MKVHFFQRYHGKENVATANAMLLLSRLYSFSPEKFFRLLTSEFLPENSSVELHLGLQEGNGTSVPDAEISQPSFKIVIETKLHGQFEPEQLRNHLNSFDDEKYKVLLTLDVHDMSDALKNQIAEEVSAYNREEESNVLHRHLTFGRLISAIGNLLEDRDREMLDILDDYRDSCYRDHLVTDGWKRMRVHLAGTTLAINRELNLFYNDVDRGFSDYDYLGLYSQKAVRSIGKVYAIVVAGMKEGSLFVDSVEKGSLTEEMKERIRRAIEDGYRYGYDLNHPNRYFFVEKFIDTFYEKESPNAPMGARVFDLTQVLETEVLPKTVEEIAEQLRKYSWK